MLCLMFLRPPVKKMLDYRLSSVELSCYSPTGSHTSYGRDYTMLLATLHWQTNPTTTSWSRYLIYLVTKGWQVELALAYFQYIFAHGNFVSPSWGSNQEPPDYKPVYQPIVHYIKYHIIRQMTDNHQHLRICRHLSLDWRQLYLVMLGIV